MTTYTVHMPRNALIGDPDAVEGMVLVRDGFSFMALIFSFVWLLVNRLWLAALLVFSISFGLMGIAEMMDMPSSLSFALDLAFSLLLALEMSSLHRWTLKRRQLMMTDVVIAESYEDAEVKAIARWLERGPRDHMRVYDKKQTRSTIIGLFPEPERA